MQKVFISFLLVLSGFVIIVGAYTRLTDAGLGCPDWPGCYGQLLVYKNFGIKAWTEMAHRYMASSLGFGILCLAFWQKQKITWGLLALVLFQGALGAWTVTWQLMPLVVMGHLLGGMTIFCSLLWLRTAAIKTPGPKHFALFALVITYLQIALGGWVSSNYAALACVGFPTCNGQWLPAMDFSESFKFWVPLGINYEGGWLNTVSRVTIHQSHRLGALITAVTLITLSILLWRQAVLRGLALILLLLLTLQIILGIANILTLLFLPVAVAHNGVGLLLLGCVVLINTHLWKTNNNG